MEAAILSIVEQLSPIDDTSFCDYDTMKELCESLLKPLLDDKDLSKEKLTFLLKKQALLNEKISSSWVEKYKVCDIALWSGHNDYCDQSSPLLLIEEIIEVTDKENARLVFDYIEHRVDKITTNMISGKGKGLIFLRLCNEMLKRLARTNNNVFCGRILVLLANVFPLSERSGVNYKGDFNFDNKTLFTVQESRTDKMKVDGEDNDDAAESEEKKKEDELRDFYVLFWSLQEYFISPISMLDENNVLKFEGFRKSMEALISQFKKFEPQDNNSTSSSSRSKRKKEEENDAKVTSDLKEGNFFPKYLTDWSLFRLQLNDPHFRSQLLIQSMIYLSFLTTLGPSYVHKNQTQIINRPLLQSLYRHTLSVDQDNFVVNTYATLRGMLETIPNGGIQMRRTLQTVSTNEKNWLKWKQTGCASFEKQPINLNENVKRIPKKTTDAIQVPGYPKNLGTPQLTSLWEFGTDMDAALKQKAERIKQTVKPLDEFITDLDYSFTPEMKLEEGVEEAYLPYNVDKTFNWRAYRVVRRDRFAVFMAAPNPSPTSHVSGHTLLQKWRRNKDPRPGTPENTNGENNELLNDEDDSKSKKEDAEDKDSKATKEEAEEKDCKVSKDDGEKQNDTLEVEGSKSEVVKTEEEKASGDEVKKEEVKKSEEVIPKTKESDLKDGDDKVKEEEAVDVEMKEASEEQPVVVPLSDVKDVTRSPVLETEKAEPQDSSPNVAINEKRVEEDETMGEPELKRQKMDTDQ